MKTVLVLLVALVLSGCGGEGEPEPEALTQEQACTEAERVTDTYRDALDDAATPEDARSVIDGAIRGLRDLDAPAPVASRVDALASALSGLLEAVEAGTPPSQLQPRASAIGAATVQLAQACGRTGQ